MSYGRKPEVVDPATMGAASSALAVLGEAGAHLVRAHRAWIEARVDYEAKRLTAIEAVGSTGVGGAFSIAGADAVETSWRSGEAQ